MVELRRSMSSEKGRGFSIEVTQTGDEARPSQVAEPRLSFGMREKFQSEPAYSGSAIPGGTQEESARVEAFALKLDRYEEAGKPVNVDLPETVETVSAKEAELAFRSRVVEIFQSPAVDAFIASIHPDDFSKIVSELAMISVQGREWNRGWAGVLLQEVSKKAALTNGKVVRDKKVLEQHVRNFRKDFAKLSDETLSRVELLGTRDDIEAAENRYADLIAAQSRRGGTQSVDTYLRNLLREHIKEMRREALQREKEAPALLGTDLQGEKKEKKREAQEWLDQERETAFAELIQFFKSEEEKGPDALKEWFRDTFNPMLEEAGIPPLSLDELRSLQFVEVTSASSSEIADQEIIRPALLFTDVAEFQKLAVKFQGAGAEKVRGIMAPPQIFKEGSATSKTGLIISTANRDYIGHEVRHSIDPYSGKREGVHRVLDEAFAYYHDEIALRDGRDADYQEYGQSLDNDVYYQEYTKDVEGAVSRENFKKMIDEVVTILRLLTERFGKIEVQRMIVKAGTIEELKQLGL